MPRRRTPQERMDGLVAGLDPGEVVTLDLDRLDVQAWWVDDLHKAERNIRQLRRQLQDRLDGVKRPCAHLGCRQTVSGRADRRYCSDACRQAGHRLRHAPTRELASATNG